MSDDIKQCPFCAEDIKAAAIVCKHCGRELSTGGIGGQINDNASPAPKAKSSSFLKVLLILFVVVVGGCFFLTAIGSLFSGASEISSPATTRTPSPTAHPPINLSGRGDDVVNVDWPATQLAIMDIRYTGTSNFIITSLDSSGDSIDLIVNTIGRYEGVRPFNLDENPSLLEIKSSGPWQITISNLDTAKLVTSYPYTSRGDEVIRLSPGRRSGRTELAHNGESNFIVFGFSGSGRPDLLVNDIGAYSGVVFFDEVRYLVVRADGAWGIGTP